MRSHPALQHKTTLHLQEKVSLPTEASTKHKETFFGPYLLIWKMRALENSPNPLGGCLLDSLDCKRPVAWLGEGRDLPGPEA